MVNQHSVDSSKQLSPYLHHSILPDDHAPMGWLCFARGRLAPRRCRCHKAAVHIFLGRRCTRIRVSVQHFLLVIHCVAAHAFNNSQQCEDWLKASVRRRTELLPHVMDDGLCFRLTPDGVLFDGAAHFVFCCKHSAHVSVGTQCDDTRLLLNQKPV